VTTNLPRLLNFVALFPPGLDSLYKRIIGQISESVAVWNAVRNKVLCIVLSCCSARAHLSKGQPQGLFT
jgi:hypothetical protein